MSADKSVITQWVSAPAAVALLQPILGEKHAQAVLIKRASERLIRIKAKRFTRIGPDGAIIETCHDVELTRDIFWGSLFGGLRADWSIGDFTAFVPLSLDSERWETIGLQFERLGLEELESETSPHQRYSGLAEQGQTAESRRGARRSPFWNMLTVEVSRRIFVGDLKPPLDRLRVKTELLAWLAEKGHTPDRTTVDPYFNLLVEVLNEEASDKG